MKRKILSSIIMIAIVLQFVLGAAVTTNAATPNITITDFGVNETYWGEMPYLYGDIKSDTNLTKFTIQYYNTLYTSPITEYNLSSGVKTWKLNNFIMQTGTDGKYQYPLAYPGTYTLKVTVYAGNYAKEFTANITVKPRYTIQYYNQKYGTFTNPSDIPNADFKPGDVITVRIIGQWSEIIRYRYSWNSRPEGMFEGRWTSNKAENCEAKFDVTIPNSQIASLNIELNNDSHAQYDLNLLVGNTFKVNLPSTKVIYKGSAFITNKNEPCSLGGEHQWSTVSDAFGTHDHCSKCGVYYGIPNSLTKTTVNTQYGPATFETERDTSPCANSWKHNWVTVTDLFGTREHCTVCGAYLGNPPATTPTTPVTPGNNPPVIKALCDSFFVDTKFKLSILFKASDPDGDIAYYKLLVPDSAEKILLNGAVDTEPGNDMYRISAADMDKIEYVPTTRYRNQPLQVIVSDGKSEASIVLNLINPNVSDTPKVNHAPVITPKADTINQSTEAPLTSMFTATDEDGDISDYTFIVDAAQAAKIIKVKNNANVSVETKSTYTYYKVKAAEANNVYFVPNSEIRCQVIEVLVSDGKAEGHAVFNVVNPTVNQAPLLTAGNATLLRNQTFPMSYIVKCTDPDGDAITEYTFKEDPNTIAFGTISLNGVKNLSSEPGTYKINGVDLNKVDYVSGKIPGVKYLTISASDGKVTKTVTAMIETLDQNRAPVVSMSINITLTFQDIKGYTNMEKVVKLSEFFTVSDPDNDKITEYKFTDPAGGAQIKLDQGAINLSKEAGVIWIKAEDLDKVKYELTNGEYSNEDITVSAFDGQEWGSAQANIGLFHTVIELKNKVSGYIKPDLEISDNSMLAGFKVEIAGTNYSAITDSKGYFELKDIPSNPSGITIKISKPGYLPREVKVSNFTIDIQIASIGMYAGDLNNDGVINMADTFLVSKAFASSVQDANYLPQLDINKDGAVNMSDVLVIAKNFGKTSASYPTLSY